MLFSCGDCLQPLFFCFNANESGKAEWLFHGRTEIGQGRQLGLSIVWVINCPITNALRQM